MNSNNKLFPKAALGITEHLLTDDVWKSLTSLVRLHDSSQALGRYSTVAKHQVAIGISVPEVVPDWKGNLAKYWSEWQDLNLRSPRPERVS
jgi:hypothetical protein